MPQDIVDRARSTTRVIAVRSRGAGVCIQAGPVLTADSRICQMELGLEGKVAIVTGGSKGIGRATALAFLNEGACVLICARGQQGLDDALTAAGHAARERVDAIAADLMQAAAIKQVVARCVERFGRIDILVNNAGSARPG